MRQNNLKSLDLDLHPTVLIYLIGLSGSGKSSLGKYVPHVKPGQELRERVNAAYQAELKVQATEQPPLKAATG